MYRIVQTVEGRLVSEDVPAENLEAWLAVRGMQIDGRNKNKRHRTELQGQPFISGLCGPMWDGNGVIRYEDEEAYSHLSY